MERLNLKYESSLKAFKTLKQMAGEPYSLMMRDATILRFEYTFETVWKFLKEFLKEKEGKVENSPKAIFRAYFSTGHLTESEAEQYLQMTDDRNNIVHIYHEEVAKEIFGRIPTYVKLWEKLFQHLKDKI